MDGFVYLPGDDPQDPGPLARYLPPAPQGVAAAFLEQHTAPGDWVLDPFGAAPRLAVEMARLGRRVLVAVNNPVARFLLEVVADPPPAAERRAALAELAAARKGEERLETALQSLYLTTCAKCQRRVPAEAFVWERGGKAPAARIYRCPCGENGEFPAAEEDLASAARIAGTDGLHRARALERVAAPTDPDRSHVAEALECYLPRAVHALITIVNKLESLPLAPERRRALLALVLSAFDEANTLWPHPAERPRPKQLTVPPRFLEKNVWLALERGLELWQGEGTPVEVVNWPSLPAGTGGLCLFEGPVRDLAPHLKEIPIAAVVTALPRPNQAYWTLSALWAGWLWGREAAAPFKSVLRRRRYDWNWHAAALYAALKNLSGRLPLNAPLFALVPEMEPAFLSAVLLAAAGAGFDLNGLALRTRHDPAQILWRRRAFSRQDSGEDEATIDPGNVRQAMLDTLGERGEPLPYLHLHAAGMAAMAADHTLRWREEAISALHTPIQEALAGTGFVHHAESPNPESGMWGLTEWDPETEPLPDRVEVALVGLLQKQPVQSLRDLETALNLEFPALQTPSLGLIRAVLTSYAVETDGLWKLRPEDAPAARRADLESAAQALNALAPRLRYTPGRVVSPWRLVLWQEARQTAYSFHLVASALAGRILRRERPAQGQPVLVLPGGRAGLLAYKLERDPSLKSALEGWRVIKFRHLRRLAEMADLTRPRWEKELSGDPIEAPEQMKLF